MAERTPRGKRRSKVIDVGDEKAADDEGEGEGDQAEKDSDEEEPEADDKGGADDEDAFLAEAANIIDVADDGTAQPSGEWPAIAEKPAKRERGGSLVKRDPMQAYMA